METASMGLFRVLKKSAYQHSYTSLFNMVYLICLILTKTEVKAVKGGMCEAFCCRGQELPGVLSSPWGCRAIDLFIALYKCLVDFFFTLEQSWGISPLVVASYLMNTLFLKLSKKWLKLPKMPNYSVFKIISHIKGTITIHVLVMWCSFREFNWRGWCL